MANKKLVIQNTSANIDLPYREITAPSIKAGLLRISDSTRAICLSDGYGVGNFGGKCTNVTIKVYEGRKLMNEVVLHVYRHFSTYHLSSVHTPDIIKHYELVRYK